MWKLDYDNIDYENVEKSEELLRKTEVEKFGFPFPELIDISERSLDENYSMNYKISKWHINNEFYNFNMFPDRLYGDLEDSAFLVRAFFKEVDGVMDLLSRKEILGSYAQNMVFVDRLNKLINIDIKSCGINNPIIRDVVDRDYYTASLELNTEPVYGIEVSFTNGIVGSKSEITEKFEEIFTNSELFIKNFLRRNSCYSESYKDYGGFDDNVFYFPLNEEERVDVILVDKEILVKRIVEGNVRNF